MKLVIREVPGAVVINIRGKFTGGTENCNKFRGLIKSLIREGKTNIVINLSETPWANSQGVGMMIGAHTSVTQAGGELVLAHVTDRIHDILSVTRLLLLFRTFENDDEAVEYLTESEQAAEITTVA